MFAGLMLIFVGMVFIIISLISLVLKGEVRGEVAVGGFIGPIPFGFFTSKKAFLLWLTIMVVGLALWFLARKI